MNYDEFIRSKLVTAAPCGFDPQPFKVPLFHFQRDVTDFLIRIGRGAAFLDTGLMKA